MRLNPVNDPYLPKLCHENEKIKNNNKKTTIKVTLTKVLNIWNKKTDLAFYSELLDFVWVCLILSFEGLQTSYIINKTS